MGEGSSSDALAVRFLPRHALAFLRLVGAPHELVVLVGARADVKLVLQLQAATEALRVQWRSRNDFAMGECTWPSGEKTKEGTHLGAAREAALGDAVADARQQLSPRA